MHKFRWHIKLLLFWIPISQNWLFEHFLWNSYFVNNFCFICLFIKCIDKHLCSTCVCVTVYVSVCVLLLFCMFVQLTHIHTCMWVVQTYKTKCCSGFYLISFANNICYCHRFQKVKVLQIPYNNNKTNPQNTRTFI